MTYSIEHLLYLMQRLRKPGSGCPWDLAQDYRSITPSTIEEVYEVVDAIDRNDFVHLPEELGDVLFQVVFYAQLGSEQQHFDFADIVHTLTAKLIRRHPHVFPDGSLDSERDVHDGQQSSAVNERWEKIKSEERAAKGQLGIVDDVPKSLPALQRAQKLQKRVAKAGMDFRSIEDVLARLKSEITELEAELVQADVNGAAVQAELGDVLFSVVNLARHLKVDSDQCLRDANRKFEHRIKHMQNILTAEQRCIADCSDAQLEQLWQQAKTNARTN